jgi:hypothetical protein
MSKLRIKISGSMRSMAGAQAFCAIRYPVTNSQANSAGSIPVTRSTVTRSRQCLSSLGRGRIDRSRVVVMLACPMISSTRLLLAEGQPR